MPIITDDTKIAARSIASHQGFAGCSVMTAPSATCGLCRKSSSGCGYVHNPGNWWEWLTPTRPNS